MGSLIRNCDNLIGLSERYIRNFLKTPVKNRMVLEKLTGILLAFQQASRLLWVLRQFEQLG